MPFELGVQARKAGFRAVSYDVIGSTNAEALARARAGEPGGIWVAAGRQTAGKGRRGRQWESPPGNLAASLLVILDGPASGAAAQLGFVAGLALHAALGRLVPAASLEVGPDGGQSEDRLRFELKWPNDVVAQGAKLAGILLESERLGADKLAVVVGIGVNVAAAPADTPYPATCLHALGVEVPAEAVFRELADAWVDLAALWDGGRGMAEIRQLWLARGAGIGAAIAVRSGRRVLRGTFETIDERGRLVVRFADGASEAVAAAEVHFGAVASAAMQS